MPIEHDPRRTTTPAPRFAPAPAADASAAMRAAALVIQVAAFAIVLAALPYPIFQLDRYTFPKELVLGVAALAASLLCLSSARRLTVFMVDVLLGGFLVLSLASTLLATNGWLAFRALGVSLAGAALFWCARTIARSGRGEALLLALAAAVVLGSVTGLAQAYGLVETNLASLTRAPGGTFGNRNFMAHLVAMGLPAPPLRLGGVALAGRVRARQRGDNAGRRRAGALPVARRVAGRGHVSRLPRGRGTLGGPAVGGRRGSAGASGGSARWRRRGWRSR